MAELAQLGLQLQKHHGFPSSPITTPSLVPVPLSYPEELTNLPLFIMGKHILLCCKG